MVLRCHLCDLGVPSWQLVNRGLCVVALSFDSVIRGVQDICELFGTVLENELAFPGGCGFAQWTGEREF